ncbi:putative defensin-like protein 305 [Pecten maximus]|uniref:putative defensin-like protein 305 n=1 Tax=Pecten maximus TaxID=6579 RepID=UPI00145841E2|nr:putative defensin-like protein 305 [Pecten maximus]
MKVALVLGFLVLVAAVSAEHEACKANPDCTTDCPQPGHIHICLNGNCHCHSKHLCTSNSQCHCVGDFTVNCEHSHCHCV